MTAELEDVITIDNFYSKMSRLDLGSNPLFGLVDMGSNGIRFSISDLSQPRSRLLPCIYRERQGISLYDALHESAPDSKPFNFSASVIARVGQALARFKFICTQYGVPPHQINVFATEAMRTAENRNDMLQAIHKDSRLVVNILSPSIESLLGAMGARSGYYQVNGLFMDLGGGSVQMTYLNSREPEYELLAANNARSMPFGAAKLTQALNNLSQSSATAQELQHAMEITFNRLKDQFHGLREQAESSDGVTIYFCGGGFRGYGSMQMHKHHVQPYPISDIGGFIVAGEKFVQTRAMLKANDAEGKVFGMSKRRRQQFFAIVAVVDALVRAIPRIKKVIFCSGGNREGVLYMKLPREIRESNPFIVYPSSFKPDPDVSVDAIVTLISRSLPSNVPSIFSTELQEYLVRNIWVGMGSSDEANSAQALHAPISGVISGLPGLAHDIRAVLSLTMCARWGTDLGPMDRALYQSLRHLLGPNLSFWCDYVGTVARLIANILPAFPSDSALLQQAVELVASDLTVTSDSRVTSNDNDRFHADESVRLGKSQKKSGIKLSVRVGKAEQVFADEGSIRSMFKHVGKGLDVDMRIEVEISLINR